MKRIPIDLRGGDTVDLTKAGKFLRRIHRYPRNGEWRSLPASRPSLWQRLKQFFRRKEST